MKTLYTDASFDWTHTEKNGEDVVRGKICVVGEGLTIVEQVTIGKVPELKQYINILELVAIARAVEIAGQRQWDEELFINTDSSTARAWARNGTNASKISEAHKNALDYLKRAGQAYPKEISVGFIARDLNPAGHVLETELEKEKPHAVNEDDENRCGKPHNNGEGEESCIECQMIKRNL